MSEFAGVFLDGQTAADHQVKVRFTVDAIIIEGAPSGAQSWPYRTVKRVDSGPGRLRLQSSDSPDARLDITDPDGRALTELKQFAPRQFSNRAVASRTLALTFALMLAGGAIVAAGVFGLPRLSGPLARMTPPEAESQIGSFYLETLTQWWTICEAANEGEARAALDTLSEPILEAADSPFNVTIQVVDASFPNAFALPGGHVLVTDELLDLMETPEELAGVLAHEIAHVERRHVMAAMIRQFGLAIAVEAIVGGGSGAGQQLVLAGADLTSIAHTRTAEQEADDMGIAYLRAAKIDPEGLARFFDTIDSLEDNSRLDVPEWIKNVTRTHPHSASRAATIRAALDDDTTYAPVISADEWAALKAACPASGRWSVEAPSHGDTSKAERKKAAQKADQD